MASMSHYHLHLRPLALQRLPSRRRLHRLQDHAAMGPGCLHHDPAAADGLSRRVCVGSMHRGRHFISSTHVCTGSQRFHLIPGVARGGGVCAGCGNLERHEARHKADAPGVCAVPPMHLVAHLKGPRRADDPSLAPHVASLALVAHADLPHTVKDDLVLAAGQCVRALLSLLSTENAVRG